MLLQFQLVQILRRPTTGPLKKDGVLRMETTLFRTSLKSSHRVRYRSVANSECARNGSAMVTATISLSASLPSDVVGLQVLKEKPVC